MSGIAQTLQTPPPVSVQTLLYGIYQAASSGGGGGGSTTWGSITGTLSSQTDLSTALAGKLAITSNLSDLANAATARTNLGLGTIATQAASAVAITGGTATGLTGLGIRSTGAAFDLTFATSEALTAGRTLSFNVGDGNRTLTIAESMSVAGRNVANTFTAAQTIAPSSAATCLTLTGGTVTTSNPLIDAAQTWNNAGTTFTGFKLNVTNTASAVASKLFDFQIGGTSLLGLEPATLRVNTIIGGASNFDGAIQMSTAGYGSIVIGDKAGGSGAFRGRIAIGIGTGGAMSTGVSLCAGSVLAWASSTTNPLSTGVLFLSRKSDNTLQIGSDAAGVSDQMFTAANRITSDGVGANLTLAAGNGRGAAGGSLILSTFDTAGAGTVGTLRSRMTFDTAGAVAFPVVTAVTTETVVSDTTWPVTINGVTYKILLKA